MGRALVTVLIVSSTCCYRGECAAILRTIGPAVPELSFVFSPKDFPGDLRGIFAGTSCVDPSFVRCTLLRLGLPFGVGVD